MRAIDYQWSLPLSQTNQILFKVNTVKKLTAFDVAELVDLTSSKVFTSEEKRVKPDLSFETAKLAILGLYDLIENEFPFEFNAKSIEVHNVALNREQVEITWRLKGGTSAIDNNLSIEEYIKYTAKATDSNETLAVIKSLKEEFENYIPLHEIRKRLAHLSRGKQDDAINALSKTDIIELSTLNEPINYTKEQLNAGIPTKIGTYLFFVILN